MIHVRFAKLGLSLCTILALAAVPAVAGAASSTLGVKRLVLAHGIDGHEPQDASSTFKSSDDRVYAFIEIENPTKSEGTIEVVFEPPTGPAFAEIPLKVGDTSRFRTWAFTRRAHEAGEWNVVVRTESGKVLAREKFTVVK